MSKSKSKPNRIDPAAQRRLNNGDAPGEVILSCANSVTILTRRMHKDADTVTPEMHRIRMQSIELYALAIVAAVGKLEAA